MFQDLDTIINRILAEERVKTEVVTTPVPQPRYRCDEGKFNIEYNEATEVARYFFDGQEGFFETPIPLKQRNYYVDTGYWKVI